MIKYDYTYFHNVLLRLKSLNFERYQHISEKDLLIQALNGEEIIDYSEIDWQWIKSELYGREGVEMTNNIRHFNINGELEKFISPIVPRTERVRILTYLRDHCRECLFNEYYDNKCISKFETECARLISREIEESKRDEYHGDFASWPRPCLTEIALPPQKQPEFSIMETAILNAIPKFPRGRNVITKDILLCVAYEFIEYFRLSVKAYEEKGIDVLRMPIMNYKEHEKKIYNQIIRRANRYLFWDNTPVYKVYFIVGCLMKLPDDRRSSYEEKFADGIGDYIETTTKVKCKEKIQNVIEGILTLSKYQMDFDMENIEKAMKEQKEQQEKNTASSDKEETMKRPLVFISYSWDDKEHEDWVLKLAKDLRCNNGIDIILDKWDMKLGKPLTHFMSHAVTDSDRVICVMTPNYKKKTENLVGGVGVEYSIITAEIQKDIKTEKFIPLFRKGEEIPTFLAGRDYIDMRDDNKYGEAIEDLVRDIFNKPKYKKPELGAIPKLD